MNSVRLAPPPSQLCNLFVSDAGNGFFGLIETATQASLLWSHDAVEADIPASTKRA